MFRTRSSLFAVVAALITLGAYETPGMAKEANGPAVYETLRDRALGIRPEDIGAKPDTQVVRVYGVVMDWDIGGQTATVVAFVSGDASVYLSTGGGMIGGFSHPTVVEAAKRWVEEAQTRTGVMTKASAFPRPGAGMVIFYLLTTKGVLTAERKEEALAHGGNDLSPLFAAGQHVLAQLRQASPAER